MIGNYPKALYICSLFFKILDNSPTRTRSSKSGKEIIWRSYIIIYLFCCSVMMDLDVSIIGVLICPMIFSRIFFQHTLNHTKRRAWIVRIGTLRSWRKILYFDSNNFQNVFYFSVPYSIRYCHKFFP